MFFAKRYFNVRLEFYLTVKCSFGVWLKAVAFQTTGRVLGGRFPGVDPEISGPGYSNWRLAEAFLIAV